MGYKFKIVEMTTAELDEAEARIGRKAPKDWFTCSEIHEPRGVLDTLAAKGRIESSCVTRSCPYYRVKP